jgi:hypothetical protein
MTRAAVGAGRATKFRAREGAALADVGVSWIGAGRFGLLVTLSLVLESGVVPPTESP